MERIGPLEDKLNYKIEKLTKMGTDNVDLNDPLQTKPDIDNLDIGKKKQINICYNYFLSQASL